LKNSIGKTPQDAGGVKKRSDAARTQKKRQGDFLLWRVSDQARGRKGHSILGSGEVVGRGRVFLFQRTQLMVHRGDELSSVSTPSCFFIDSNFEGVAPPGGLAVSAKDLATPGTGLLGGEGQTINRSRPNPLFRTGRGGDPREGKDPTRRKSAS